MFPQWQIHNFSLSKFFINIKNEIIRIFILNHDTCFSFIGMNLLFYISEGSPHWIQPYYLILCYYYRSKSKLNLVRSRLVIRLQGVLCFILPIQLQRSSHLQQNLSLTYNPPIPLFPHKLHLSWSGEAALGHLTHAHA